ncbi:hypothetical protein OHC33_003349 [Knufia fluminis]|uniref:Zinc finger C3HC4 RING-type domain-containing protein n=1 Tax=Knufia fluminis TaxID=191047 RepID=A0AAN8F3B4_9EURO|nr:hypothetical protein OHC33_003349 [Knufia fluminis]
MEANLRCNNHHSGYCRNELRDEAFVTTCSHIFCRDCVQKHGFQDPAGGRRACLACGTELPSPKDVVYANLRPTEEYQSTILCGLDPNIILECASKALRFWNYQMSTEIAWQEHLYKEMTTRYSSLHNNAQQVIDDANTEIAELQKQIEGLNIEKRDAEKRTEEMANLYKEKSKRAQTTQQLYEALKNKVQAEQTRGAAAASADHTLQSIGAISRPESFAHHAGRHAVPDMTVRRTPHQNRFPVDHAGVEQLHPFQRSGSAPRAQTSSEVAAAAHAMAPPMRPVGRDPLHRVSTTSTPAQRVSLPHGRATSNHTFPQSMHRPTPSQQYVSHSIDRHALGQERSRYQHAAFAGQAVSPNIHSRMPANRGLY